MQYASTAPMPCILCKVTKVKPGGATGMCVKCRAERPDIADIQRANAKMIRVEGRKFMERMSDPVPGQPGLRKVNFAKMMRGE